MRKIFLGGLIVETNCILEYKPPPHFRQVIVYKMGGVLAGHYGSTDTRLKQMQAGSEGGGYVHVSTDTPSLDLKAGVLLAEEGIPPQQVLCSDSLFLFLTLTLLGWRGGRLGIEFKEITTYLRIMGSSCSYWNVLNAYNSS